MSRWSRANKLIRLSEIESTNLYLKEMLLRQRPDEFMVVASDFQTKGRGQMGNSWTADRGQNLLFSILLYPQFVKPNEQFIISQMVSIAIAKVLSRYTSDIRIKWPNDIYWRDHKIAGILIENSILGQIIDRSIIGVGLNINQSEYPKFLVNAISLSMITGKRYSLDDILDQIMDAIIEQYNGIVDGNMEPTVAEYMSMLYRYGDGAYHLYEDNDAQFYAKIVEVKPSGHLALQAKGEDNVRLYAFKEVQFIIE